jgi:calmodulin
LTTSTGDITAQELGEVMKSLGLNPSDSELQDIVNEADLNKDGVINFEGSFRHLPSFLPSLLSSFYRYRASSASLNCLLFFSLTLSVCARRLEFLNLMSQTVKETDTEQELINAFKVFDQDGSGTISTDELRKVLSSLGENLTDAELDEMIQLADKNGDGQIDCE